MAFNHFAVGRFGESFPFGSAAGDRDIQIPFNEGFFVFLQSPFTFYASREFSFNVCVIICIATVTFKIM